MTTEDELVERVALALAEDGGELALLWSEYDENFREAFRVPARTAVAALRAYDAERRSSVLDAAAIHHDPDDYRDLPLAMTGPVRFRGGLTEG